MLRAFQVKTTEKLEIISGETMIKAMEFYSKKEDIPMKAFQNGTKITEIPSELWDSVILFQEGDGTEWYSLTQLMEDVTESELISSTNHEEEI